MLPTVFIVQSQELTLPPPAAILAPYIQKPISILISYIKPFIFEYISVLCSLQYKGEIERITQHTPENIVSHIFPALGVTSQYHFRKFNFIRKYIILISSSFPVDEVNMLGENLQKR